MERYEKLRELLKDRKWAVIMTVCGVLGLLLIMLSSLVPTDRKEIKAEKESSVTEPSEYRSMTEKRLESFLSSIEGAGEVKVYLTVGSGERYIYASEGRTSRGESKTEEERKYVIIAEGGEKNALVETVEVPEITGAVIACDGGDSAAVRERMYKSAAAALGISTSKIFVTKLR